MANWFGTQYHRLKKRECPKSIAIPGQIRNEFQEVENPFEGTADTKPTATIQGVSPLLNFKRNEHFLGLFGRLVQSDTLRCYQYVWVWDSQPFPPHAMDYAPAILYTNLGENTDSLVHYDYFHYWKRSLRLRNGERARFRVNPFWHSFWWARGYTEEQTDGYPKVEPLTDTHLRRWWGEDGVIERWYGRTGDQTPYLKPKKYLRNPRGMIVPWFHRFGSESPNTIPSLEQAAMWIAYPFAIAAMRNENLENCLQTVADLIGADSSLKSGYPAKLVAGYVASVVLFYGHGMLVLKSTRPLKAFLDALERNLTVRPDALRLAVETKSLTPRAIELEPTEETAEYYRELKVAIENDKRFRVLEEQILHWFAQIRPDSPFKQRVKRYLIEKRILNEEEMSWLE